MRPLFDITLIGLTALAAGLLWVRLASRRKSPPPPQVSAPADFPPYPRPVPPEPAPGPMVFGAFGTTVETALKSSFFTWFHLGETGRTAEKDGAETITYSPTADQFRPLVSVSLTVQDGFIRRAGLVIQRRFIDDPRQYASAADITKSFILDGVSDQDRPLAQDMADEIFAYRPHGATAVVIRRAMPGETQSASVGSTPGYAAYSDPTQTCSCPLVTARLDFTNDPDALSVDIRPRADPPI